MPFADDPDPEDLDVDRLGCAILAAAVTLAALFAFGFVALLKSATPKVHPLEVETTCPHCHETISPHSFGSPAKR